MTATPSTLSSRWADLVGVRVAPAPCIAAVRRRARPDGSYLRDGFTGTSVRKTDSQPDAFGPSAGEITAAQGGRKVSSHGRAVELVAPPSFTVT